MHVINSGRQVLNPSHTQGLHEFVCSSSLLHSADGPRSVFISLLTAWKAANQFLINMPLPARLILNSSF